ncbi:MAG: HEAT repeat domain-containing protein [Methanobacteriaceae archaeon]|nr:HEAT repeat domain-containing protein [Methanobacteriaceae archaeon]
MGGGYMEKEQIIDFVVRKLEDEDTGVRRVAIQALGDMGDEKAVDSLIKMLSDDNKRIRSKTEKSLIKIGNKSVKPLIKALKSKKAVVRSSAARVLGKIADKQAVLPLVDALKDEDKQVRKEAALSLMHLGWKAKNIDEEAYYLIAMNSWNFTEIGGPSAAVDALIQFIDDKDVEIRKHVINSLSRAYNSLKKGK